MDSYYHKTSAEIARELKELLDAPSAPQQSQGDSVKFVPRRQFCGHYPEENCGCGSLGANSAGELWPKPVEPTQAIPRNGAMRTFETGATRNTDEGKYDFEGFFSPLVLERRAAYMHKHRLQADGNLRASDNWQFGIPLTAYMKSAYRHFHEWWKAHRGTATAPHRTAEDLEESICSLMFNCEGYLHELLKEKHAKLPDSR